MAPVRHYSAIFSFQRAFASHFIAPHDPTLYFYISALMKPSKMTGNLACYPFNSWLIDIS